MFNVLGSRISLGLENLAVLGLLLKIYAFGS